MPQNVPENLLNLASFRSHFEVIFGILAKTAQDGSQIAQEGTKMGQGKPLLLSVRYTSYTGVPSCQLPFSSLPSQVGCSACVSAQRARIAEGNTSLDGLQAAIHRAQSVAVYRDVAASAPAGMQVWQIGRTITLVLLTTV